jgi:hypothetical protein
VPLDPGLLLPVKEKAGAVKETGRAVKETSAAVKEASGVVKEASGVVEEASRSVKEAGRAVEDGSPPGSGGALLRQKTALNRQDDLFFIFSATAPIPGRVSSCEALVPHVKHQELKRKY